MKPKTRDALLQKEAQFKASPGKPSGKLANPVPPSQFNHQPMQILRQDTLTNQSHLKQPEHAPLK